MAWLIWIRAIAKQQSFLDTTRPNYKIWLKWARAISFLLFTFDRNSVSSDTAHMH